MTCTPQPVQYPHFIDSAPTHIYTLSLHDALPIYPVERPSSSRVSTSACRGVRLGWGGRGRSEEHTSELQSHSDLVCRLLLEKKKIASNRGSACRGEYVPGSCTHRPSHHGSGVYQK